LYERKWILCHFCEFSCSPTCLILLMAEFLASLWWVKGK
jgi:hypothetical protein